MYANSLKRIKITNQIYRSWHTGKWSAELILDGVEKGALQIKSSIKVEPLSVSISEALLRHGDVGVYKDRISNSLGALSMDNIKWELDNLLGGSWEFIFSGGDDFFIDKAAFNR